MTNNIGDRLYFEDADLIVIAFNLVFQATRETCLAEARLRGYEI
jgi:hypothetical protein